MLSLRVPRSLTCSSQAYQSVNWTRLLSAAPAPAPAEGTFCDVPETAEDAHIHARRLQEMYDTTHLASDAPIKPTLQEGRQQQRLPTVQEVSASLRPPASAGCSSKVPDPQLDSQADWRDLLALLKAQNARPEHCNVLTDTFG